MSRADPGNAVSGRPRGGPLPPEERKPAYVRDLFARIAGQYDRMNTIMTLGRDRAWRRYTVEQALAPLSPRGRAGVRETAHRPPPHERCAGQVLDVATGTGELALEVLRRWPMLDVVGVDFAPGMLRVARKKVTQAEQKIAGAGGRLGLRLVVGDALRLPFADGIFEYVVTGFALRNVASIPAAFAEIARVTCPGGRLACLEIAKPRLPLSRWLFALYFYRLVPHLGRWITGERAAYTYLPHSLTEFLTPDQIASVMQETGWSEVRCRRLMLGTVAVHVGVRKHDGAAQPLQACQGPRTIVE